MEKYAYCTLINSNDYVWGAIGLAYSYKKLNKNHDFIFMVDEDISDETIKILKSSNLGIIKKIPTLKLTYFYNPHWIKTLEKFSVFSFEDYEKIIYIDADIILKKDLDFLYSYDNYFLVHDDYQYLGGIFMITPNKNIMDRAIYLSQTDTEMVNDEELLKKIFDKKYTHYSETIPGFEEYAFHQSSGNNVKYWKTDLQILNMQSIMEYIDNNKYVS